MPAITQISVENFFLARKIPLIPWPHFSISGSYKKEYILKADYYYAISSGITKQLIALGVNKSNIFTLFNLIKNTMLSSSGLKVKPLFSICRIFFDGQKQLAFLFISLANVTGDWQLNIVGSGEEKEIY
ncbi:MAG: hypothetical protein AB8W37_06895 [Arsenophonus endosymbiont of Dermacentor nuttalli]